MISLFRCGDALRQEYPTVRDPRLVLDLIARLNLNAPAPLGDPFPGDVVNHNIQTLDIGF
ncbi:MAG: hypothetical protein AAFY99_14500 [Pseudomonadota bacterium]